MAADGVYAAAGQHQGEVLYASAGGFVVSREVDEAFAGWVLGLGGHALYVAPELLGPWRAVPGWGKEPAPELQQAADITSATLAEIRRRMATAEELDDDQLDLAEDLWDSCLEDLDHLLDQSEDARSLGVSLRGRLACLPQRRADRARRLGDQAARAEDWHAAQEHLSECLGHLEHEESEDMKTEVCQLLRQCPVNIARSLLKEAWTCLERSNWDACESSLDSAKEAAALAAGDEAVSMEVARCREQLRLRHAEELRRWGAEAEAKAEPLAAQRCYAAALARLAEGGEAGAGAAKELREAQRGLAAAHMDQAVGLLAEAQWQLLEQELQAAAACLEGEAAGGAGSALQVELGALRRAAAEGRISEHRRQGEEAAERGEWRQADACWARALQMLGEEPQEENQELRGELRRQRCWAALTMAAEDMKQGDLSRDTGDIFKADECYSNAISVLATHEGEVVPLRGLLLLKRAEVLQRKWQHKEALADCRAALKCGVHKAEVLLLAAEGEFATTESVAELKAELRQQAATAAQREDAARAQSKQVDRDFNQQIQALTRTVQGQEERAEAQDQELKRLKEQAARLRAELDAEAEKVQEQQVQTKALETSVDSVESLAKQNYQALHEMQEQARKEQMEDLKKARQDLEKHALEVAKKDASEASEKAKKDLDGAKKEVRGEMSKGLQQLQENLSESMKKTFESLEKNLKETREALEARCDAVLKETREKQQALELSLADARKAQEEAREQTDQQLAEEKRSREAQEAAFKQDLQQLHEDLKERSKELREQDLGCLEQLGQLRRETDERISAVLAECRSDLQLLQGETTRLGGYCAGVSGLPTRQVEWRLNEDTIQQLEKVQDRVCVDDPALEGDAQTSFFSPPFEAAGARGMQLELRVHTRNGEEEEGRNQCSLYLWAPKGLQLVFRLFMGTESVILRHGFDGKAPCGLKRMGSIMEQKQMDGSLRLGIEIHESLMESTGSGSGAISNPMDETSVTQGPVDGNLAVQRYLNHRLLELMQSQGKAFLDQLHKKVDVMRSRAIRRVQWRLENGPLLLSFAKDQAVRSTAFQAAGISGMQLVFYPQGCAGARPGFCSFFLSCPPGCTLRCWLWAGRWRREARPEPAEQPDCVGRVNFARFENVIDPVDESVELVLEIEEAQQAKALSSQLENSRVESSEFKPGATQSLTENSKDVRLERSDVATMKIRHDGKASEAGTQQLPSIWTSQGFHSFDEEQMSRGPPPSAKGQSAPPTPRRPPEGGRPKGRKGGNGNANGRAMSARDKYKEYGHSSQPLPQPSY
ncbi:unnamed protein product [Effrenium voratum]|nr:unnamed protein product [Effrenium voratum]